jgi:hypothetical protein
MEKAIASAIAESNATGVKDMGKVMAALKARYISHRAPLPNFGGQINFQRPPSRRAFLFQSSVEVEFPFCSKSVDNGEDGESPGASRQMKAHCPSDEVFRFVSR